MGIGVPGSLEKSILSPETHGAIAKGKIYERSSIATPFITGTHLTSMKQDRTWLNYMRVSRIDTIDAYSAARHNCRLYSRWEFRDASLHMGPP